MLRQNRLLLLAEQKGSGLEKSIDEIIYYVNLIGQLDQDSFPIASSSSGRGVLFEEITR